MDKSEKTTGDTPHPIKAEFSSGYAEVNGLRMYYEIHGDGEGVPLVLIHGGGSSIDVSFGAVLQLFASGRKVIAMDLQAHGRSGDRDADTSFQQDADDVAALLIELNITKADLMGFSNGGSTAMQLAIRHPRLVNKIIIASAFYKREGLHDEFWQFMETEDINSMPQALQTAYMSLEHTEEELKNMHDKDAKRMNTFTDWNDEDLRSIKAEAMIISGDKDVVRVEHSLLMSQLIEGASLLILPGGHGEYLGEAGTAADSHVYPHATVALINAFLNR